MSSRRPGSSKACRIFVPRFDYFDETVILPGEVVAGKYRVERLLGEGGMGTVVAARHLELDTLVALKFLRAGLAQNSDAVARFVREARAASKIQNEHVARVTDVFMTSQGAPFMVMEYLEGRDLAQHLREQGPLRVEEAVDFVLQAGVAIAHAHSLGIVHRDLKPANLFCVLRNDGKTRIKVLDFGISKLLQPLAANELSVTKTSSFMGSPLYMSPEQLHNAKEVDVRADIWSLGVILFELLAGKVPFFGQTVAEVAIKATTNPTPSLTHSAPNTPAGLAQVIERCLEKQREQRFADMAAFARALGAFAAPSSAPLVERIVASLASTATQGEGFLLPTLAVRAEIAWSGAQHLPETAPPWANIEPTTAARKPRKAWSRPLFAALSVAAGTAGLLGLRLLREPPAQDGASGQTASRTEAALRASAAQRSSSAPSEEPVAPASSREPEILPEVAVSEHAEPIGAASLASAAPPAPQRATSPKRSSAQPIPEARAAAGAKPNCDPPYRLDDDGRKRFKPECFLSPKP